jgi:hypothetical protein
MGATSEAVEGEWCAPTRELKNSQLLVLVHKTRKLIRETLQPIEVTAESPDDDVVLLVDRKHPQVEPARIAGQSMARVPAYPVLPDRYRPIRFVLAAVGALTIGVVAGLFAFVV